MAQQQSLYRRYRPQTFDDVVGQRHIVRTLRNAIGDGSVAHSYLFTGPRGTGKTTTARLLAKSLNCAQGPTPEPDTTCDSCIEIAEGRHPDVHELDAASRTGVDAVREEIITKVNFAPTRGRSKVYIIDEVHMLSTSAFNALLKTLEEPPAHTVFVLCTTHPHKVPETIHSRCQRFDFHRIAVEDMVGQLDTIAASEGIDAAPGVMTLIARHAAGGLRDAISILDQLAAFTGKKIGLEDVESLIGEVDTSLLLEAADLVADRDVAGAFRFVATRADLGTDMTEFARGMVGHFRDLYVVSAAGDAGGIVDTTEENLARMRSQAERFGPNRLARCLDVLGELLVEIRWAADPRLALEVALTRLAGPASDVTLESILERVESLEHGAVARPAPVSPAQSEGGRVPEGTTSPPDAEIRGSQSEAATAAPRPSPSASRSMPGDAPDASGALDRATVKRAWPAIVAEVKRGSASKSFLFTNTEVDVDGDAIVVEFPGDQRLAMEKAGESDTMQMLRAGVAAVLGAETDLRFQLGRGPVEPAEPETQPADPTDEASPGTQADTSGSEDGPEVGRPPEQPGDDDVQSALGDMLMRDLGAQPVEEIPTDHTSGEGDQGEAEHR
jgi:DNA polymerase-3 subunit gamma/tau